ncbi:MAG: hypothetical protein U9Q19_05410 [Pseudomonadota bacterium]|nr:hypothetical protein [Pseudomonadota bacterium]
MRLFRLCLAAGLMMGMNAQAADLQVNLNTNPKHCDGTDIATPDQTVTHKIFWDTQPMPGPAADAADCSAEEWVDPPGARVIDLEANASTAQFQVPNGAKVYLRARASLEGVPSALTPEVMIETPAAPVSSPQRPVLWVVGVFGDLTAVFGPVTQPTQYPNNATTQGAQRFRITGVINTIGPDYQGLISRDASGQDDPGHFSVGIGADGTVQLRNQPGQDAAGTNLPSVRLVSLQPVVAGEEFGITITIGPTNGLTLAVDGQDPVSAAEYHPLTGNTLPLTVGATCSSCVEYTGAPIRRPLDGWVRVQVYATEQ